MLNKRVFISVSMTCQLARTHYDGYIHIHIYIYIHMYKQIYIYNYLYVE
jgi:hypothetical protein